ncbi:arylsulfatase [Luteolibacter soli]|uniref:Arylsulfatase n=1 Tax=Luteolibacter soli TaxID=3135280 RepID=A0ABU9AVA1_9BACT
MPRLTLHLSFLLTLTLPLAAQTLPITTNLKLHLDASSLSSLPNNATVTSWPDLATTYIPGDTAQNATLTNGLGTPKFISSDPLLGNKPAVSFAGTDALGFAGSLGLNSAEAAQPFTVFVVATNNKTAISPAISIGDIHNGISDGAAGASLKCDLSTTAAGLRFNDGSRLFGTGNFEANKYHIGMFRMAAGETYAAGTFRSDNRTATQSSVANGTRTPNFADEGYHIGAGINSANGNLEERMNGRIAEILFYNRALTETESNQVGLYLTQKYSLTTNYTPPGPDTRPNVLLILMDDTGWSDLGCYGGEAHTPRIDALAANGVRFRNFHNTARCSTTRAALLTGNYTHQVAQNPGASLPDLRTDNNITIPELLRDKGYRTYMAGKWHLGTDPGERTTDRGFQHVFGFGAQASGSGADYWDESQYTLKSLDNEIPQRTYPANTFYQSDAIADHAIDFIDHHLAKSDSSKFFLYLPFNPPHFSLQAPAALADTYMATYAQGWDVVRQARYDRMRALGIIDATYPEAPFSDTPYNTNPVIQPVPAWNTLDADRKADLVRRMALYTAMIDRVDYSIGRVIDRLQTANLLDNTIVLLMTDNGGNAEGGVFGKSYGTNNRAPLTGNELTNAGQRGMNDNLWLGGGWANVCNVPFRYYKRFSHEGGIRTPLIVHWPAGIVQPNRWTDQNGHLIDIMATIAAATGSPVPTTFAGHTVLPPEGTSLLPILQNQATFPRQLGYEHESTRAWVDGEWKLVTKTFASTDGTSPANALELYHITTDPTELHNLAATEPERLKAMVTAWNAWATRVGVPTGRLLHTPIATPAPLSTDLFVDNFNRDDSVDADEDSQGMSGSRVPPIGANNAYYEGFEGSGTADSIQISEGALQVAVGVGMAENGISHNFIGQDIIDAGGFSVQMNIRAISDTTGTQPADRYLGFGVGLNKTEASLGSDISGPNSFRGSTTNPTGKADFFIDLDLNGNLKAWRKGQLIATVNVGKTTGTLTAKFALTGFTTTSNVEVTVFFEGKAIDLNPADPNSITQSFTWDANDMNYIGISGRANEYTELDNLAIRKLPLADTLSTEHAIQKGLAGTDTAPNADPDHDGRPNFLEWATGTDPNVPDTNLAPITLLEATPSNSTLRFQSRRLTQATQSDLDYTILISEDLEHWTPITPLTISSPTPIPNNPGYETVELQLPPTSFTGTNTLFVIIDTKPKQGT